MLPVICFEYDLSFDNKCQRYIHTKHKFGFRKRSLSSERKPIFVHAILDGKRVGYIRPNPEGRIIKNWKAEFKAVPEGQI